MSAAREVFPIRRKGNTKVPLWTETIEPLKRTALFWHAIWCENNHPEHGVVANICRKTRSDYHRAIKLAYKNRKRLKNEQMVQNILRDKNKNLWKEIKKLNPKPTKVPATMDGETKAKDIANIFKDKFEQVYNCNPTDSTELQDMEYEINRRINFCSLDTVTVLNVQVVKDAITLLNRGKTDGVNGFATDHIIHSPTVCHVMFSLMFSSMLTHGCLPDQIQHSIIVPIPKNINKNMCSSDNYRGITLCSPICKLFECIIYNEYKSYLSTSQYQYAYKSDHSTVMCATTLKETVSYYKNRHSTVYAGLIDATKAYDRLKFGKLFNILLQRGIPGTVLRLLYIMHTKQLINIKWNNNFSECFSAENGVRQGGITSGLFFNVYMDILLKTLEKDGTGCHIGHMFVGCLCYADDLTLLSPSLTGLQRMIHLCELFGEDYSTTLQKQFVLHSQKTNVMKQITI